VKLGKDQLFISHHRNNLSVIALSDIPFDIEEKYATRWIQEERGPPKAICASSFHC